MEPDCLKIDSNTNFKSWYFNEEHFRKYAIKCKKLLEKLEDLRVYESRYYKDRNHVCWFVSFKNIAEEKICYILHFDVKSEDIFVYFRFYDYVTKDKMIPNTSRWLNRYRSIYIHYNEYPEERIIEIISDYINNIRVNFELDKLPCRKRRPCDRR